MTKQIKRFRQVTTLVTVLLLQWPLQSSASDDQSSWYLGLGGGVSTMNLDTNNSGYFIDSNKDTGQRIFAGYDFNHHFSVEAMYSDLGGVTLDNNANPALLPDGRVGYTIGSINLLWYLWADTDNSTYSKRKGFQAFVQGGVSVMQNESNVNYDQGGSVGISTGGGIEYEWENGFAIRAGADLFAEDATFFYVGLLKRFGKEQGTPIKPRVERPIPIKAAPVVVPVDDTFVVIDKDKDGVDDRGDNCPATRANIDVDIKGCSIFQTAIEGVYFEAGSVKLTKESLKALNSIVKTLLRFPREKFEVQAHTDNRGSIKDNLQLSNARANAVHRYLVSKGVSAKHLTKKGYGESRPVATNMYMAGRAKNRRVELKIIE